MQVFRQSLNAAVQKFSCNSEPLVELVAPLKSAVSYAEVKGWSHSLASLLRNSVGQTMFKLFLEGEHSTENLEFWLAVEKFKKIPGSKTERAFYEAERIFNAHICLESATAEISLDSKTRCAIEKSSSRYILTILL